MLHCLTVLCWLTGDRPSREHPTHFSGRKLANLLRGNSMPTLSILLQMYVTALSPDNHHSLPYTYYWSHISVLWVALLRRTTSFVLYIPITRQANTSLSLSSSSVDVYMPRRFVCVMCVCVCTPHTSFFIEIRKKERNFVDIYTHTRRAPSKLKQHSCSHAKLGATFFPFFL